ncbi:hypothetical protein [uncultured Cellulomonas sp.]|uniref:hypothetical protein n=1 Tax=uncultured Cellulomonas sp. TaxID=189682 RepID=UPI0026258431|nr:hypothetical protein [uncultured Cellulomonas sp.]
MALSDARLVAPTLIEVAANSCHGDPRIAALEQGSDEVLVEVEALVAPAGDQPMCLDMLTIELTTELGARRLVDTTSGATLLVATE